MLDAEMMQTFSTSVVLPGLMLCKFAAALNYENAETFLDTVLEAIREARPPLRLLILRCAFVDIVDYIDARMLAELSDRLKSEGVSLAPQRMFADAEVSVRMRGPRNHRLGKRVYFNRVCNGHLYRPLPSAA